MKLSRFNFFIVSKRFFHERASQKSANWTKPSGFPTGVSVYNPIIKCNVPLILKNEKIATWYMCGPTVYDSAHIGHACTYVRFDIIRRILNRFFDINVISVMGITDIDDKIIKRSLDSKEDTKQLTKRYEQEFFKEMKSLNIIPPYLYCRVTDYLPQIIEFIGRLVSMGMAYLGKDGCIYFDTGRYDKYGKLHKSQVEETHSIKKKSSDFALWKAAKENEPFWESPWGRGRPGWHIECSAIASTTLGKAIDIHSGGIDLLFPHHENEEAQSCCYHKTDQWVNYWLHSGHLYLSGDEKMSKSLQNTISIHDLLEKYSSNQFRLLCLLTHYRSGIEFSHDKMQSAITILNKLQYFLSDCRNYVSGKLIAGSVDETAALHALRITNEKVCAALADDFDTTRVVLAIQELVALVNKMINQTAETSDGSVQARSTSCIAAIAEYIRDTLFALGISDDEAIAKDNNQLTEIVDVFVKFRRVVRNRALEQTVKDKCLLEACDDARDNLSASGIKIKDHKNTSTWTLTKNER